MPTTVRDRAFKLMVEPSTSVRPPKRDCHVSKDRMITRSLPRRSSCGEKRRPIVGCTPSAASASADAVMPMISDGWPFTRRLPRAPATSPKYSSDRFRSRAAMKLALAMMPRVVFRLRLVSQTETMRSGSL